MKKKNFLVIGIDYSQKYADKPIQIIVQCTCSDDAIEMAQEEVDGIQKRFHWYVDRLTNIKRIKPKDLIIKEIMQTTYSKEQLIKTIQMYENMLLNGVNFKTLGDIFAPYLIMYDSILEECIVSKTTTREKLIADGKVAGAIMDVGFRFLPKKFKLFDNNDSNFKLWYQKTNDLSDFKLVLKQGENGSFVEREFTDFVLELSKLIPDVPVRLEKVVIQNL